MSRFRLLCAAIALAAIGYLIPTSSADALSLDEQTFLNRVTQPCKNQDFAFNDTASLIQPWYYIDYVGEYQRVWSDNAIVRKYRVCDAMYVGTSWLPVNEFPYFNTTHHRVCNHNPSGR